MNLLFLILLAITAPIAQAAPGLTIYNQNFAVVRDTLPLDLPSGTSEIVFDGATRLLEPDSVILRDASGAPLRIFEQNYRNDPVTQQLLLSLSEGKELDFFVREPNKPDRTVKGKIIRATSDQAPIIEVDGKIQFSLPGEPLFSSIGDNTILKPRLVWKIQAPQAIKSEAEIAYITGGLTWQASYNIIAPEKGNTFDIIGWITMQNQSGRDFENAKIKLLAGDVNKISPPPSGSLARMTASAMAMSEPEVTEKTFDDFHLYTLQRPTTLLQQETKQVEFIRASAVQSETIYTYDGADISNWQSIDPAFRRANDDFGTQSSTKIAITREFKNTKQNNLGIPLPKGRIRFYRADGDTLEFTGENELDHTPADELIKIHTGDAFDLIGERKRTDFRVDTANNAATETFEITLRNRKKDPVSIRVIEHLYRSANWKINANSEPFTKPQSHQIQFLIPVKPGEERKLTYTVNYTW
ncbi:MAG: DUF4139 domain-containing protein [Proteobacteria bacterium]|nr:DUF4139 domain-containing protein [Pseudomonadota bacterium]